MKRVSHVTGAILAGGQSSRMGQDKALLVLNGAPIIRNIAGVMAPLLSELVVLANRPDRYTFLHLPVWEDLIPGCGPLSGIHSALSRIETDAVVVVACDLPHVSSQSILTLLETMGDEDAALAADGERIHPLFGVYRKSALPVVARHLAEGKFSVKGALAELNTRLVQLPSYDVENINTPDDYQRALSDGISCSDVTHKDC